jgi:hypothetical protein
MAMKVKASVLREILKVPTRDESRFIVGGVHLRDTAIEVTDTRMLVRVPCEPEESAEKFPGKTYGRPFGLPAPTGDKKSGWFGKLRLAAVGAVLRIANKDRQRTEVDELEGTWPKSGETLKGLSPAFTIVISPFLFGKIMAIMRAGAVKEDDCAVTVTVYKNSQGRCDVTPIAFRQSCSGIEAFLAPTRDPRAEK